MATPEISKTNAYLHVAEDHVEQQRQLVEIALHNRCGLHFEWFVELC